MASRTLRAVAPKSAIELQVPEVVLLSTLTPLLPEGVNHNVISPFKFDGLKDDITKYGFDEPIQVWESDGKLWVVNGHKRYAAMLALGAPECLIVRKRFADRTEALAYSIRRNQERGQNDDELLSKMVKELARDFKTLDDMERGLTLQERELYDLTTYNKELELPKRAHGERTAREKFVVKVQLALSLDVKSMLDRAVKQALKGLRALDGDDPDTLPLPHSTALKVILSAYLDK